ncbi:RING-type domain-containing protein [Mycena sanguinolenta]|uniref:RING-type domain-containing protein n=1 Tax=Mycena sanguinolenta TaxID=230812 RepID=A0A8H6XAI4_9AGAR|nr:RING-type domain-containing protein [Mycena sanguinolenta]
MSSREPLWYCHECNAEMRPLMVPDPVCASCHGSFVEKMENPTDDPREFHRQAGPDFGGDDLPIGLETFLLALSGMAAERAAARSHSPPRSPPRSPDLRTSGPRITRTVEFRSGSGPTTSIRFGTPLGPTSMGSENPDQPTMTDFLGRPPPDGPAAAINGPLMARYLMALLGREHLSDVFARGMGDGPQPGRMGDYVFNQEALDQIITQLMESSNNSRPVPATDEIMENLPREVLEQGSSTLEKDCAVCKEQFSLNTEDPDEQVVVTLPCMHPFHEPCIMPWLKSSGTCPVCRHALVPQPEHHGPPPSGDSGSGNGNVRRPPMSPGSPGGLFQSLFGSMGGSSSPPSGSGGGNHRGGAGGSSSHRRSSSDTTGRHVPGGWEEELD